MSLILVCLAIPALVIWVLYPSDKVLASWTSPKTTGDEEQYQLSLVERDIQLFYGPFERRLEVRVGRGVHGGVVHIIPVQLFGEAKARQCAGTCQVKWTQRGVEFTQASGHSMFIPLDAYKGGR